MPKHLFLEGPVQTGKSTLLRKYLIPYKDLLGGFCSQRLLDDKKEAVAYRITGPEDLDVEIPYSPGLPHVFAVKKSIGSEKNMDVFRDYGVSLLDSAAEKPLILLDEIGGSELLVPEFRARLYEILSGNSPCLGVIKLNEKARSMSREADYPGIVADYNAMLRKDLAESFEAEIIACGSDTGQHIAEFLSHIGLPSDREQNI
mgnify:CR=1 FL=1